MKTDKNSACSNTCNSACDHAGNSACCCINKQCDGKKHCSCDNKISCCGNFTQLHEKPLSNKNTCKNTHFCSHDQDIKKITTVFFFICVFLALELWGHFKTKSLSLLADALHLAVDISGFIISIFTLHLSKRAPDSKMSFGYERAEILGALFSVFFIWAAIVYLVMESVHKYLNPNEIDGKTFLVIAAVGLMVNLVCMFILHHNHHTHTGEKQNLNMRATYIHVIGDIIQSVGVLIASAIIFFFPKALVVDILCTLFFAVLVMFSTIRIVIDAVNILTEGVPKGINLEEIKNKILTFDNVVKVSDIKVWSISVNRTSAMVNVLTNHIEINEYNQLLTVIRNYLSKDIGISLVNVQIDTPVTNQRGTGLEIEGISISSLL